MAARYGIARRIAACLERLGMRPDVSAAEGVMISDTLGAWESWQWVRGRLKEPAEGIFG
jgi:hypothetical protein